MFSLELSTSPTLQIREFGSDLRFPHEKGPADEKAGGIHMVLALPPLDMAQDKSDTKRSRECPKSHSNLRAKNNPKNSNGSQVCAKLLSPAQWEGNQGQ